MADLSSLLPLLARGPRGAAPGVVNPYRDELPRLDRRGGARARRENLSLYLELVGEPRLILIGEALGFRGGRFSGIAFTSERQLAGVGPRRLPWADGRFAATSRNPALWLEPSGTVVWGALGGAPRGVLLWNAFPWHPSGARGPLSNRAPERRLVEANLHVLERLLAETAGAAVLAVGRTAAAALARLGIEAPALRHPAHGGASIFRQQLRRHLPPARAKLPPRNPLSEQRPLGRATLRVAEPIDRAPQRVSGGGRMSRRLTPSALAFLALALLALPAAAESFHVTLTDGTSFETRYQPQEASWDASMVLLLTDVGNWIGLPKDSIASVVADMGETGFGTRINSTTISLGPAPNDAAIPEEEEVAAGRAAGPAAARNAQEQLLESYMQQRRSEESYSIQQFVEPNQTQGIPSRFVGSPTGGSRPFP